MTVPCTHVMCTFRFLRIPLRANLPAHSGVQKREYRTFPKRTLNKALYSVLYVQSLVVCFRQLAFSHRHPVPPGDDGDASLRR